LENAVKYSGSCHCGKVAFDVDATIEKVVSCNCSRCRRTGALLAAAKKADFTLKSGKDALTEHQFNKHFIHHYFCSTCSIGPYSEGKDPDGSEMVMINVRCLEGVDPESFDVMKLDGAKM
jgi:hypothetical protein